MPDADDFPTCDECEHSNYSYTGCMHPKMVNTSKHEEGWPIPTVPYGCVLHSSLQSEDDT